MAVGDGEFYPESAITDFAGMHEDIGPSTSPDEVLTIVQAIGEITQRAVLSALRSDADMVTVTIERIIDQATETHGAIMARVMGYSVPKDKAADIMECGQREGVTFYELHNPIQ